jgi:hypothetical protein
VKKILLLAVLSIGMPMNGLLTFASNAQEEIPSVVTKESNPDARINRKQQNGRPISVENNNNAGCCQSPPSDFQTGKEISAQSDPNSIPCAAVRCASPGYQK